MLLIEPYTRWEKCVNMLRRAKGHNYNHTLYYNDYYNNYNCTRIAYNVYEYENKQNATNKNGKDYTFKLSVCGQLVGK